MSDFKKFSEGTIRFISAIESAVPKIRTLNPEHMQLLQKSIKLHHNGIVQLTSSIAMVKELKLFCSDLSKLKTPELVPAIKRYKYILNKINLDLIEESELQSEISRLLGKFEVDIKLEGVISVSASQVGHMQINDIISLGDKKLEFDVVGSELNTVEEPAVDQPLIQNDTGTPPPEPTLRVLLTGDSDKVKGRSVVRGARCVLSVDWGLLNNETIVSLTGNELKRAREEKLEIVFVLYRGCFEVTDNTTRITTRFKDDGFERPVSFHLIAPGVPAEKSDINLEIEIHGLPAIRIRVSLNVVQDLSSVSTEAMATPVKVDLDKLIANARRSPPAAILRIVSSAVPSAELMLIKTGDVFISREDALTQTSIANQLGYIATHMDSVVQDPIWNTLSDPLNPTDYELELLSEPLAKVAAAGSELHEWLTITAGMRDILYHIDNLPIGSRIIVRSDGVAIPWETIYPVDYCIHQSDNNYATTVDHTKFWGYRFEFETIMSPGQRQLPEGDTDRIEQHRNATRKLTAVMNGDIDSEMDWKAGKPVDFQLNAFNKETGKTLAEIQIKIECPDARNVVEKEHTFGPFIYFYCHGRAARPFDPDVAVLQINDQCQISVGDVKHNFTFFDAPIVFLNSCSSGPLASISFDSFCARFLHKGALGLITTSFGVPAPFAARFGCELILQYMRAEKTLGEILLDLRRNALDQRIPIGLFYMLRCPGDVSLKSN